MFEEVEVDFNSSLDSLIGSVDSLLDPVFGIGINELKDFKKDLDGLCNSPFINSIYAKKESKNYYNELNDAIYSQVNLMKSLVIDYVTSNHLSFDSNDINSIRLSRFNIPEKLLNSNDSLIKSAVSGIKYAFRAMSAIEMYRMNSIY